MNERERIEREVLELPHFVLQLGEPGCKAHMFEIAHGFYVAHKDVVSLVLRERAAAFESAAVAVRSSGGANAIPHSELIRALAAQERAQ